MLSKLILISETIFLISYLVNCENLPFKINQTKEVPNILTLIEGQSSYRSRVEIIDSDYVSIEIDEYYNLIQQSGWFNYPSTIKESSVKQVNYHNSGQKFIITDTKCITERLDQQSGQETIREWIQPNNLSNLNLIASDYQILGPSVLLVYVKSVENETQFIESEIIDGHLTDHWSYCVNTVSGPFIDFWFEVKSGKPFRLTISFPKQLDSTSVVYNFIKFEPSSDETESIVYPYGLGCQPLTDQVEPVVKTFPWNKNSDSFSLTMEAVISYASPDIQSLLTTAKIIKYQETFSFELNDESNVTRIVQNGQHLGRYLISPATGQCQIDDISPLEIDSNSGHSHITVWPYHNQREFNLLTKIILEPEVEANYMGSVVIFQREKLDIYEQLLRGFFLYDSSSTIDAVADYYFPVSSAGQSSVPSKIIVKPINVDKIVSHQPIPSLIEITTIDYSEDLVSETISGQFDVSNCYADVGRYTWFQLILTAFQDLPVVNEEETIKREMSKLLESFIPKLRLPEIRVTLLGANVYVTCKLLERPSIRFNFVSQDSYTIDNPTLVIGQDHLEDCGQLCSNDKDCFEFSYCMDTRCLIFSPESPSLSEISFNVNCSLFHRIVYDLDDNEETKDDPSSNILTSSRTILHQLKHKLDSGLIVIPNLQLSADQLLIVDGPEEIGPLTEEYQDDQYATKVNNYHLIVQNRRLLTDSVSSTINEISYKQCLIACENDDDCYTLSYCSSSGLTECILSNERSKLLIDSLQQLTGYGDNCNLYEKSYLSFYTKYPGSSLVTDTLESVETIDSVDCAHRCLQLNSTCQSFDYCKSVNQANSSGSICFLHDLHVSTNQLINGTNIWDFSKSECDHYAKRLSQDYQQLPGVKFNDDQIDGDDLIKVIGEMKNISLENCASNCNQLTNDDCKSFEYCETIGKKSQVNFISSCRLSTYKPTETINNDQQLKLSVDQCSIYVNQRSTDNHGQLTEGNYSIAITLDSLFFIGAFACGVIASICYVKQRQTM